MRANASRRFTQRTCWVPGLALASRPACCSCCRRTMRCVSLPAPAPARLCCPAAPHLVRLGLPVLAVVAALLSPADWLAPRITPYKGLPRSLAVMGAEVVEEQSQFLRPADDRAQRRHPAPARAGPQPHGTSELPRQLAVFHGRRRHDSDDDPQGSRVVQKWARRDDFDAAVSPGMTHPRASWFSRAGGGTEVLQAIYHDARPYDAVELNPGMLELAARAWLQDWARALARWRCPRIDPRASAAVRSHPDGPARFLRRVGGRRAGAGRKATCTRWRRSPITTTGWRPAVGSRLTRWEKQPPRDGLKLFAMAIERLLRQSRARRASRPGSRLANQYAPDRAARAPGR